MLSTEFCRRIAWFKPDSVLEDKRSGHLLFAIVAPLDAYFVDVRPHPPPGGVEWVSQELLRIVHSNWPELIEANVLHGVRGSELTDGEMHELRRKNVNYAMDIDGKAIAPLLGGLAGDGSSVLCTFLASSLLKELRYHEEALRSEEVCKSRSNSGPRKRSDNLIVAE